MPAVAAPAAPTLDGSRETGADGGDANALPDLGALLEAVNKVTSEEDASGDWSAPVKLAVVFTGLALVPAGLVMMTSFTRIVIVLSFVRRALTTQTIPPNIAIVGLSVFLTLFVMAPTFSRLNDEALAPYLAGQVPFQAAIDRGFAVVKQFMLRQTHESDLVMFLDFAHAAPPETPEAVPMHVAIPAFAISEFRTAFEMGCLLFIPFLLIDLVIAGILLSAGMMMLPPIIVSLPFKIILFVLVDGWALLVQSLVMSFY
ncbi:MAG: flagellar type III secretion system pore protein FliP [Planctomycetes bacterium]|nr:flagellar type III secretion system pore protein FliP [Planctomycetota bacterium]